MTDYELVPDSDIFVQWVQIPDPGDHFEAINEAHGAPNDADMITAGVDSIIDEFGLTTDTIDGNITQVVVWTRHQEVSDAEIHTEVDFYDGNAWQGYQELPYVFVGWTWTAKTFAGLDMDQTDVNNAKIRFRSDTGIPKAQTQSVSCTYVVITSVPAPPSGPAGIAKVYGIESGSIAKKYGVAWSNIKEIYGII